MRSELDTQICARRPGLTRQNQAFAALVRPEDVTRRHVDLTFDDGRYARTAATLPTRVWNVDPRPQQGVDESLVGRPAQPVPLTVKVDLEVCNFCHAAIIWPSDVATGVRARWPAKLDRSVR